MKSICGADCSACFMNTNCKGCIATNGAPFGEKCMVACMCEKGENALESFKEGLIAEFNSLGIPYMNPVTELNALCGAFVNMEFTLENGSKVKLLNDNKIYLGTQIEKNGTDRCYGLAADEKYLLVCEYGKDGSDAEIVVFKRWK